MSQSHKIKGGATDEVFEEQCFLWESGASVNFFFSPFLTLQIFYIHKRTKKSPLMRLILRYIEELFSLSNVRYCEKSLTVSRSQIISACFADR